jgi:osmotically-inducible protein OsmY
MKLEKTRRAIAIAATFAFLACSDRESAEPTPGVDAEGPRATAERDYAAADPERVPSEVDNTGRNVRDRDDATLTPADQSNSALDLELTKSIRQGITSNDEMSLQARNVKVISQDGVVTLRGPVETEEERASIEALARNAGATRIDNQLEIDRDIDSEQEDY